MEYIIVLLLFKIKSFLNMFLQKPFKYTIYVIVHVFLTNSSSYFIFADVALKF